MADLLDKLESHFRGQYEIERSEIQHAKRLTLKHLDLAINVDLFTTGKVNVGGRDSLLKEEVERLVEGFRKDPHSFEKLAEEAGEAGGITPEEVIMRHMSKELFAFLPEHDRRALVAAFQVLLSGLNLADYSPVTMPVGRAYEGFLGELVVRVGMCTRTAIQDPKYNIMYGFDSKEAKALMGRVSTHEAKIESAKQRLKEFRHIQLHSQSSQFVQCRTADEANRFVERVLRDMQALYDYFGKFFV